MLTDLAADQQCARDRELIFERDARLVARDPLERHQLAADRFYSPLDRRLPEP